MINVGYRFEQFERTASELEVNELAASEDTECNDGGKQGDAASRIPLNIVH